MILDQDVEIVNQALDYLVPSLEKPYRDLYIAARYSLLASGKRIRPLLAIATGKMFGASMQVLVQPACALEMVHAYSLIHDDLPALDNDDYRRGKPSLHKMHGEDTAILAGDFLLTYSFEVLAHAPHLHDAQKVRLISTLAKAAGGEGMIGGQIMDLSKKNHDLKVVNAKKTGALLKASILFGGIIAEVSSPLLVSLGEIGDNIGLLFQVCDDILDGERDHDFEEAKQEADALFDDSVKKLNGLPGEKNDLYEIFKRIIAQISLA